MEELARCLRMNEVEYIIALSRATGSPFEESGAILKASLMGSHSFFNEALIKDGPTPPSAMEVEAMERFYAEHGIPFNVHAHRGNDHQGFLGAMARLGYLWHASYSGMAVELSALKPSPRPAGVELKKIARKEDMMAFYRTAARGNELPADICEELVRVMSRIDPSAEDDMVFLLAERDRAPIATSILFRGTTSAGIYFVCTVPEERGKGIGGWITYEALRMAEADGHKVGVLGASAKGYPVYRRLGFLDVAVIDEYIKA